MKSEAAAEWASSLDAVVVYAQGALCTRVATGTVPADGRVLVTGLPRSMDAGSLRAKVLGDRGVRVTEVRVEVDAEPSGTDTVGTLRQEMDRLRDVCAAAQGRRDRQVNLIAEVAGLRPVPPARKREDPPRHTAADAWLRLAEFVDERLRGLHDRLVELEEDLRRVQHEFSVATDRWMRASTDVPSEHVATTVVALLTLDGSGSGTVEVELEYGVPGAVWVPAYRLTHRQGDDSGTLVLRASVAQRTGEDWNGVRIALATADLRRRTDLPRLRSIRVGRRQPAPAPSGWREPPTGLADLFSGYDAAGPRPAPAVVPVPAVAPAPGPVPPLPPPAPPGYGMAGPESTGVVSAPPAAFGAVPPPPPPAPQGYGMPPAAFPEPSGPAAAPSAVFDTAVPHPAPPARSGRPSAGAGRVAGPPPIAPAAPPPPPSAPVPSGPPRPSGAELDYAGLVLSGADEPSGRRGKLFPRAPHDPVADEHRRRAEAVAALPLPGHAVRPRESAGSFDHRYDAVARADIPSDGTWHTVTVTEIAVGLHTEYLCVPSVEQTVYGTLVLANATDQALLAGPVEVTSDDDFLTTAALPTLAPGGVRRMGLGPAEGIRVTRRTNLRESTSGLRNNTTVLAHQIHVELSNRLAQAVTVEVHEQVPVTSEPDVRIDEHADWTTPEQDGGPDRHAPGTRIWRVDLPAGGSASLDGGYDIRVPAAKALVGGNRRS
ncbi:DUF4139 domain-containing protein [Streptomyces chartreusis]|uniref:DUF4139 domain-containing protein n=1 Tax=Streptomyces chartreusis TaxID=1969 RepID=A0A7I0NT37_STRCX|nr:DUF4139 domain-containing protein [Streptomyces chartreusis]QKZ16230.1 DUF4139 domain-containing protein [Streptomyces chartreusis]